MIADRNIFPLKTVKLANILEIYPSHLFHLPHLHSAQCFYTTSSFLQPIKALFLLFFFPCAGPFIHNFCHENLLLSYLQALLYDSQHVESESVRHSVVSDSATPWTVVHQAPLSMEFYMQESWSGCPGHFLLQGIFLTHE